jgi:transitional endoplasmic reticulum ATPase
VFFDEIDTIFPIRSDSDKSANTERLVTTLLTEMDGLEEIRNVVVIGATNRPDKIDPAILRPGRFDHIIELLLPDFAAREAILHIHTQKKPIEPDIKLKYLAEETDGFSGAEIKGVTNLASSYTTSRFLEKLKRTQQSPTNEEVKKATESQKPKILKEDLDKAIEVFRSSMKNRR